MQKKAKLGNYPNTWFVKGSVKGLLKVQPTPDGELKKIVQDDLNLVQGPFGGTLKIVEKGGQLITSGQKKQQKFGQVN